MKQITNKEYEEWQKYKAEKAKGHILLLDTVLFICEANGYDAGRIRLRRGSFVSIGATCFTCTVDVEYAPAEEGGESINTAYTVVFVMNGGIWLAASVVS